MDATTKDRTVWLFYHTLAQMWSAAAMPPLSERRHGRRTPHREIAVFPVSALPQQLLDEARGQGAPGADRGDLADDRAADERQVADEIEHLVAHELIAEAQGAVHYALVVEDDAVLDRPAAGQAGGAELVDVAQEPVRARRRDFLEEAVVPMIEVERLPADAGVVEVDLVFDDQTVAGGDGDALVAVDDCDRLGDAQDRHFGVELADAGGVDEVHEQEGAAIDDRDLGAVDEDVDVGHAAGVERGQEVLDGADRTVILADRRRGVDRGRRGLQGRDAQAVEVRAHELDAVAGRRGVQLDARVDAGVHADPADADVGVEGFALYVHVHGAEK